MSEDVYELWTDSDDDYNYLIYNGKRNTGQWSDLSEVVMDSTNHNSDTPKDGIDPIEMLLSGTFEEVETKVNELQLLELLEN